MQSDDLMASMLASDSSFQERANAARKTLVVPPEKFLSVMSQLRESFDYLVTHTAIDWPAENRFELVYCVMQMNAQTEFWVSTSVPRDQPVIDTVSCLWAAAEFQEREVYDFFGVLYRNHPDLRRVFLEDDWVGFPLRKDYQDPYMLNKPQVEKLAK